MTNVVELKLVEVGDGVRLDADKILEAAKGNKFDRLAIIGQLDDGEIYFAGTANLGETLVLIEMAKRKMIP
jgi:hypothetical protein